MSLFVKLTLANYTVCMAYSSITISGPIAAGTSTTARALAEKLNLKYVAVGEFFRKYALEHNIPLYDKEQIPDDLDRKVDKEVTALAQKGAVVVDGDYIGYFTRNMDNVLKVLLTCDEKIRIERALERQSTHKETAEEIKLRQQGLYKKFHKLYSDEDYLDPKFFDLVIDTATTPLDDVVSKISEKFVS